MTQNFCHSTVTKIIIGKHTHTTQMYITTK